MWKTVQNFASFCLSYDVLKEFIRETLKNGGYYYRYIDKYKEYKQGVN